MDIYANLVKARNTLEAKETSAVAMLQKELLSEVIKETFSNHDEIPKKLVLPNFRLNKSEFEELLKRTFKELNLEVEKLKVHWYVDDEGSCLYDVWLK